MWPCKKQKKITHRLVLRQQLYTRFDMMRLINDIKDIHNINLVIIDEVARYESQHYEQLQQLVGGIFEYDYISIENNLDFLDTWYLKEQIFVENGFKKSK